MSGEIETIALQEGKTFVDWRSKLASRKFWALIAAFVTMLLTFFALPESEITQIAGIITAFGAIVVYMLAEAKVDAAREAAQQVDTTVYVQSDADQLNSKQSVTIDHPYQGYEYTSERLEGID